MSKPLIRVRDVMKPGVELVDGRETVAALLAKMEHEHTRAFIVDKRHPDDEYGIVLLADIAKKVIAEDRSPERVNVYEIMSKPVISVEADMDIRYCARLFDRFGITRAPVMEQRRLVGMVSYHDMVLRGLVKLPG